MSHHAASPPPRSEPLDSLDDSKIIYGYEVLSLAIGAIASAFSPNYTFLLISRAVLGIGIGGDYPVFATIMTEYAGKNTRGRMVGAVLANRAAGPHRRPLIASIFLASGLSDNSPGWCWAR